jgi:tetratricopeptide (TPR) repeat protein
MEILASAAAEPASDMAQNYLIRGNIMLGSQRKREAEALFAEANSAYNARHIGAAGWYPAFDGLATTYLEEERYSDALASVERALELQHDYKSALFHKAQIFDFQFRAEVYNEQSNKCTMFKHVDLAKTYYHDVVTKYPDMAVAYYNEGLMLLLLDTYWRFHPTAGCGPGDADYSPGAEAVAKHLADLDRESEANFREATMLDPKDPNAWLQLGILVMQRQEPRMSPQPLTTDFRRETLSDAIKCFTAAKALRPDDKGIGDRLNQAEAEKQALQ